MARDHFILKKALVKNGLPLRGHIENTNFEEGVSRGLYLDLLEGVVFKFRLKLLALAKTLPNNAKSQNKFKKVVY